MTRPLTLDEWQDMFEKIYTKRNDGQEIALIWLHVVWELGSIAKDMRKGDAGSLRTNLPNLFAWLCAASSKLRIKLSAVVWKKYPGVCPYCKKDSRCICLSEEKSSYDPSSLVDYREANTRPRSLEEWLAMFQTIYGNVNSIVWREQIGFHLTEEVGEVSDTIIRGHREDFKEEIADTFAWMAAISLKIDLEFDDFSLSQSAWERYPEKCYKCKNELCGCPRPTPLH